MLFHFAPAAGWMNDPNGLIHWNGRHHLFYQHNPASIDFATIGWGHASSTDLLTWCEHPEVLVPGGGGTDYDADGCFSGCAVPDADGGVLLVYTGVAGDMQLPCLAHSLDDDLERFAKDPANPVIKARPSADVVAFRDHSVRRVDGGWHQAVGGRTSQLGGAVFGFTSPNLRDWPFDQIVLDATRCDIPDSVWECPDLFVTPVATALIVSILDGHRPANEAIPLVWYATGEWSDGRLAPRTAGRLDYGDKFYAPQSYWAADGRRLQVGWIRTDLDPTVTGDSRGVMSMPRELTIRPDGTLVTRPAREVRRLRSTPQTRRLDPTQTVTTVRLSQPQSAIEFGLDASRGIAAIRLIGARVADAVEIDVTTIPADPDDTITLYFDHGVIELFVGGVPATWTHLAVTEIDVVEIHHPTLAGAVTATIWALARPAAPANP